MIFTALPERLSQEEIEEMLDAADEDGRQLNFVGVFTPTSSGPGLTTSDPISIFFLI